MHTSEIYRFISFPSKIIFILVVVYSRYEDKNNTTTSISLFIDFKKIFILHIHYINYFRAYKTTTLSMSICWHCPPLTCRRGIPSLQTTYEYEAKNIFYIIIPISIYEFNSSSTVH